MPIKTREFVQKLVFCTAGLAVLTLCSGTFAAAQVGGSSQNAGAGNISIAGGDGSPWSETVALNVFGCMEHQNVAQCEEGEITIIAPGTYGNYVFTVNNTLPGGARYAMEAWQENAHALPLTYRLRDGAGNLVLGSEEGGASLADEAALLHTATIEAGGSHTFTLSWEWPYEGRDAQADVWDTGLGSAACTKQALEYTLYLSFTAEQADPAGPGGGESGGSVPGPNPPETGDGTGLAFWGGLALVALAAFVWLVVRQKRNTAQRGKP